MPSWGYCIELYDMTWRHVLAILMVDLPIVSSPFLTFHSCSCVHHEETIETSPPFSPINDRLLLSLLLSLLLCTTFEPHVQKKHKDPRGNDSKRFADAISGGCPVRWKKNDRVLLL